MGFESKIDAMNSRSRIEPVCVVVGEERISIPRGLKPREGRLSIKAVPRWPAEPVTRTSKEEEDEDGDGDGDRDRDEDISGRCPDIPKESWYDTSTFPKEVRSRQVKAMKYSGKTPGRSNSSEESGLKPNRV